MRRMVPVGGAAPRGGALAAVALALFVASVALALVAAPPRAARAQAAQVTQSGVTSKDPAAITFSLRVTAPGGVKSAKLDYQVQNPDGAVGGSGNAQVSPGAEVDLSFTLTTRDNTRYIPVGSMFGYRWEIETNDGAKTTTPETAYLFLDGRYQWRSQTDANVTVYWYGSDEAAAQAALQATRTALDATGRLLEAKVEYPVRVLVWRSEEEGKLAMRQQSASFDAQVRSGGQRVAPDVLFVFDNVPDVVRHEAAHIVTHVAGDGPFIGVPAWLDEGTAVYMQADPGPGYRAGLGAAILANRALSLRSMQSAASRADEVNVFYGQSWSTVKYLIDEYGQPKFAQLFRTIRGGARPDDALRTVYGIDQDGLYNAWRQKNGLAPVAASGPSGGGGAAAVEATRAPLGIPTSSAGNQAAQPGGGEQGGEGQQATPDSGGSNATGAVLMLAVTVGLAAALGAGGWLFYSRKERATSAASSGASSAIAVSSNRRVSRDYMKWFLWFAAIVLVATAIRWITELVR